MNKHKKNSVSMAAELNWLSCDNCGRWEVYENTPLFRDNIKFDNNKISKMSFSCDICVLKQEISKLVDDNKALKEAVEKCSCTMEESKSSYATAVLKIPSEIKEETHKSISILREEFQETVSNPLSSSQIQQASDELNEIERRKNNVVVSGLIEGPDDLAEFIKFTNDKHNLTQPFSPNYISSCARLGKKREDSNGKRLLKITLNSTNSKRTLLNLHRFRKQDEHVPEIFVRPDLTKAQLANDKKLREEWQSKGKANFMIRRGSIVPRPGTQQHSENFADMNSQNESTERRKGASDRKSQNIKMKKTSTNSHTEEIEAGRSSTVSPITKTHKVGNARLSPVSPSTEEQNTEGANSSMASPSTEAQNTDATRSSPASPSTEAQNSDDARSSAASPSTEAQNTNAARSSPASPSTEAQNTDAAGSSIRRLG